jgi:hypothetical protein
MINFTNTLKRKSAASVGFSLYSGQITTVEHDSFPVIVGEGL